MIKRLISDAWHMLLPIFFALLLSVLQSSVWPLLITISLLLIWQIWQKWRLAMWLHKGDLISPPHAGGLWEDYYTRLMHLFRYEQHAQQELANILHRVYFAADAIDEGVILLERKFQLSYFNSIAGKLLHLSLEDIGDNLTNLVRNPQFIEYLNKQSFEEKFLLKDPIYQRTLQIQLINLEQQGFLLRALDITRLEQLEGLKKDFVANVSHELKTPITVFKGALELLIDNPALASPKKNTLLNTMQLQSNRMQQLVNDLLLLSQIEAGQSKTKTTVLLESVFARLQATYQLKADAKQQTLIWDLQENLALQAVSEELDSAFSNLLSNAIQYTPQGGVITFQAYQSAESIIVSVKDNGVGIAPIHLNYLTDRFYRVNKDRARNSGGTGLGLAIVKHILQHHNAELKISSQEGHGSQFSCVFKKSLSVG